MRGCTAKSTEGRRRGDQALAKVMHPKAIDYHARQQGIGGAESTNREC